MLDAEDNGNLELVGIGKEVGAEITDAVQALEAVAIMGDYVMEELDRALDDFDKNVRNDRRRFKRLK